MTSRIHLMALEPRTDIKTHVYTVDLPPTLQEELFRLMPPSKPGACLRTDPLKQELRCWLDQAVELKPVRCDEPARDWLVALRPIDLERLCNVIANWVDCTYRQQKRRRARTQPDSALLGKVIAMLQPELFSGHIHERSLALFDEQGRPSEEAEGLAFSAFSAQVANALVGRPFYLASGPRLTFSRLSGGTDKGYELVSNIQWMDKYPFAIALHFHVETLPFSRKAQLCVDIRIRRFIHKKWNNEPYPFMGEKGVQAYVRTDSGTLRVVPYGYRKDLRHPDWDDLARRNYEGMGAAKLPELADYFASMDGFAREGHSPQILSPYAVTATWAAENRVGTGLPVPDKADIFGLVADALSDFATPVEPLSSVTMKHLSAAYDDAKPDLWKQQPDEAEAQHELWAQANRRRLAACTGEKRITFELIGSMADDDILALARQEIVYFLGGEGCHDGLEVSISQSHQDKLLRPLEKANDEDASAEARWERIGKSLEQAECLTACVVALPNANAFKPGCDPKTAIRMGLAQTGRLAQFIVPEQNASLEHRARTAVRDLMRQLGFVPELRAKRDGVDLSIPTVGLRVYRSPRGRAAAQFPLAVRMEANEGLVSVTSPLIGCGRLPYWKAELALAKVTTSEDYQNALRGADGRSLKRMLDAFRDEATSETLLMVQAYGCIRYKSWWPGLSDKGLSKGRLRYGPASLWSGEAARDVQGDLFELGDSKLSILRVRSGADGEVPDYFTDRKGTDQSDRTHCCKQGLFPMGDYVLALTERPNATDYKWSFKCSKFDNPGKRYAEKTLNEYCLPTSDDWRKLLEYAKYAEALRGSMVQLVKSDMRVNLPAPLHLAAALDEYVWAPKRLKKGMGDRRG